MNQQKEKEYDEPVSGEEVDPQHWKCGRCGRVFSVFELGYKNIVVSTKLTISHPVHARCSNDTVRWVKKDEEGNPER